MVAIHVPRQTRQTFDPADYGAVADGVADDTAAVQTCLNDSTWSGYGGVFQPRRGGKYRLTSTIILPDGCFIQGLGGAYIQDPLGTVFYRDHNDPTPTFQTNEDAYFSYATLRDFAVVSAGGLPSVPDLTQDAFVLYGATNNTRLSNVTVGFHRGTAFKLKRQTLTPTDPSVGLNFVLDQCFAWSNAGYALHVSGNPAFVCNMGDFNGNKTGQIYLENALGNQGHAVFNGLLLEPGGSSTEHAIELHNMHGNPVCFFGGTLIGSAAGLDCVIITGESGAAVVMQGVAGFNWDNNWVNDQVTGIAYEFTGLASIATYPIRNKVVNQVDLGTSYAASGVVPGNMSVFGAIIVQGAGAPSSVAEPKGSLYLDRTNGTPWYKTGAAGAAGWAALGT